MFGEINTSPKTSASLKSLAYSRLNGWSPRKRADGTFIGLTKELWQRRAYGKEPTHLLINSHDFIKLTKHTLYLTFINNPGNTYDNLTILFTTSGPPCVALL